MVTRFGGGLACLLASLSPSVSVAQAAEDEEAEAEVEVVGPLRRGFLAIPSLGLGIPVGRSGDVLDPGLRLGALLGGHVNSTVSLNGEIVIDVLNPKNNVFSQYTAVIVDLGSQRRSRRSSRQGRARRLAFLHGPARHSVLHENFRPGREVRR